MIPLAQYGTSTKAIQAQTWACIQPIGVRGREGRTEIFQGNNMHFSEGEPQRRTTILEILTLHGSVQ